jgi:hypothetical protein
MPELRLVTMRGGVPTIVPSLDLTAAEVAYICKLVNDAGERDHDRLANAVMHWREWVLSLPAAKHQRERAVLEAYDALGSDDEYRPCSECSELRELVREAINIISGRWTRDAGSLTTNAKREEWLEKARAVVGAEGEKR